MRETPGCGRTSPRSTGALRRCLCGLLLAQVAAAPALATNGVNLIGFGSESVSMAGADVAMTRDTAALAINPAGLSAISEGRFDVSVDPYYFVDVSHADSLGNEVENQPRTGALASLAYAQRIAKHVHAGAGLYVAGGLGFRYENLNTGYGTRDDLVTRYSVIRFAPGLSWQPADGLALGAALSVNYAVARQKNFFDTSSLSLVGSGEPLFGFRLDGLDAVGVGATLGIKYALPNDVVLGAAYRSRVGLDLDGGELTVNFDALGAGRITYRDARLEGISVPQDVQLGAIFSPFDGWMVSLEYNWIDWSRAFPKFRVEASNPARDPLPLLVPESVVQEQPLELRDQHVFAIGVRHQLTGAIALRGGFNYARQPVPERRLTPLVAAIPERHFALGLEYKFGDDWRVDTTLFYIAPTTVSYSNPDSPITEDARETHETLSAQFSVSRSW